MKGQRPLNVYKVKSLWIYLTLALFWIALIYYFSNQSSEKQDITYWIHTYLPEETWRPQLSWIQFYYNGKEISIQHIGYLNFVGFMLRKLAHLVEYSILGFIMIRVLVLFFSPLVSIVLTLGCGCLLAALDEFHQRFAEHRTPLVLDVVLDMIGILIGLIAFFICYGIKSGLSNERRKP